MNQETAKKFNWDIVFFAALAGMALLYGYHDIFFMRPWSIHQWRQCDCLSIAYNYYKEGMHFFSPVINWSGPTGDGKTCTSELPWIYYLVACLWHVFGYHEFIYRMVDTAIAFTGLYFLFKLCRIVLQNGFWSLIISLLLFTSPIFVFYGNNFIVDVPSLSIAFIAWYFFYRFYKNNSTTNFYKWLFFCLLAGLTKITALLSFVPVFLIFPIELFNIYKFRPEGKIFAKPFLTIVSFVAFIGIILSWTLYAMHYNDLHNGGVFSTQTFPAWKLPGNLIQQTGRALYNTLLPEFMSSYVLTMVFILFITIVLLYKKVNRFLLFLCCTVFIGTLIYILLWFQVFTVHDYYLTNLLVFIPCVLLTFFHYLKNYQPVIFNSRVLKAIAVVILVSNIYYTTIQNRLKYYPGSSFIHYSFIVDKPVLDYWTWYHWNYNNYQKSWETVTPYLRSLALKRTDKVVSIPDQSINISLYLMDQKGYTTYGVNSSNATAQLQDFVNKGARYLIINDPSYIDSAWIKPYTYKKIGQYKNLSIFDMNYRPAHRDTLNDIISNIKKNAEWLGNITKGAKERGISLDSALILNAQFILDSQHSKN